MMKGRINNIKKAKWAKSKLGARKGGGEGTKVLETRHSSKSTLDISRRGSDGGSTGLGRLGKLCEVLVRSTSRHGRCTERSGRGGRSVGGLLDRQVELSIDPLGGHAVK